jgi:hypothetical protein
VFITGRNYPRGIAMGRLAVLLLIVGFSLGVFAKTPVPVKKPVTVEQLEQLLPALHDQPDGKAAQKLYLFELTERASPLRLQRWQASVPGKQAREALLALADASAFLDLPAAEIPSAAAPEADDLQWAFSLAIEHVVQKDRQLPNFFARRSTTHFNDLPPDNLYGDDVTKFCTDSEGYWLRCTRLAYRVQGYRSHLIPRPFHFVDRSAVEVTYRDGQEVEGSGARKSAESSSEETGLKTSGEFGPILATVIGDAVHGRVSWSH